MVRGALAHSQAQVAVAVSGVAGPGGGTMSHPVGMVCFAWGVANGAIESTVELLAGDRQAVRSRAVEIALRGLLKALV
jgi:nicotinamide-nucleotide amidase